MVLNADLVSDLLEEEGEEDGVVVVVEVEVVAVEAVAVVEVSLKVEEGVGVETLPKEVEGGTLREEEEVVEEVEDVEVEALAVAALVVEEEVQVEGLQVGEVGGEYPTARKVPSLILMSGRGSKMTYSSRKVLWEKDSLLNFKNALNPSLNHSTVVRR